MCKVVYCILFFQLTETFSCYTDDSIIAFIFIAIFFLWSSESKKKTISKLVHFALINSCNDECYDSIQPLSGVVRMKKI